MRNKSSDNAARVVLCAVLLVSAAAATLTDRTAADANTRGTSAESAAAAPSQIRLDRSVHPAADPMFGALWTASRRLIVPVKGVAPQDLVDTFAQIRGPDRRHEAIDIPAPGGTPVLAVTDGEILRLTEHDSGGITLYQLAPDGRTMFYYAHLMKYAAGVRPGLRVRQGDVIGYVGDTGNARPGNYHLHFEVMTAPDARQYHAARPRNPYPLLLRARG
ncbi:MAG TPA: M23 family metallopeptidase [Longimicrobiales bacterium]|nr:M23 family metallopeptidase [Longimicrobiales bacterium]